MSAIQPSNQSMHLNDPIAPDSLAVILPGAGSGQRFGDESNKLFASLAGRSLWQHAAERLAHRAEVSRIVLAIAETDRERFESELSEFVPPVSIELVPGGAQRSDSVQAALDHIAADSAIRWVAIHDAARPVILDEDLDAVFSAASRTGAAILASPVSGTLKRERPEGQGCTTLDRNGIWTALTPQVFHVDLIRQAYQRHRGRMATDDAQMVERSGNPVTLVPGRSDNLKITYSADLRVAQALMETAEPSSNP